MGLAALTLIPSAFQLAQGLIQNKKANDLSREDFNYIPPSLLEAEGIQRRNANTTSLPGQEIIDKQIQVADAASMENIRRGSKDSSTVLEKVQEQNAKNKAIATDMSVQLAQYKTAQEDKLNSTLKEKGNIEMGNRQRYQEAKSALKGAATQNFFNAATGAASAALMTNGFKENPYASGGSMAPPGTPPVPQQQVWGAQTPNYLANPNYPRLM